MERPTHAAAQVFVEEAERGLESRDEPTRRPGEGPREGPGGGPPLTRDALRAARLFALFLGGVFAFNYPLLEVFSARRTLFGVPLLYCWIFGAWLALIVVLARLGRKG